jgi:putative ABC transport system permease protein
LHIDRPGSARYYRGHRIHLDAAVAGMLAHRHDGILNDEGSTVTSQTLELLRAVRYCLRRSRRQPFVAAALAVVIATATTLAAVVFAIADVGWRRPFAYPAPEELYVVSVVDPATRHESRAVPTTVGRAWSELDDIRVGRFDVRPAHVELPSGSRYVVAVAASREFLELLGVQPRAGRFFGSAESNAIVVGERLWQVELNGDADIVGRSLVVGGTRRTIVGVAPTDLVVPGFPGAGAVVLPTDFGAEAVGATSSVLVRTRLPIPAITTRLNTSSGLDEFSREGHAPKLVVAVTPLGKAALPNLVAMPLFVLLTVSFLGLSWLIGGHLLAAAAVSWTRDLRIKLSLGASRASALVELVLPALIPAAIGSAAGLAGARALLSTFGVDVRTGLGLSRNPVLDADVVRAVLSANAVMTGGFLAVLWSVHARPAMNRFAFARREPAGRVRGSRFRRVLLATQMTLAAVTLILSAAAASMLAVALSVDLGLDPADVVASELWLNEPPSPVDAKVFFSQVEDNLRAIPGAEHVALVDLLPFGGAVPGREPVVVAANQQDRGVVARVGSGYFETLRIPVLAGRALTADDMTFPPTVAIVDRLFSDRYWSRQAAIGQRITVSDRTLEIVGVVGATMPVRLNRPAEPTIYVPYSDEGYRRYPAARGVLVRAAPGQRDRVRSAVDDVLGQFRSRANVQPAAMLERKIGDGAMAPRFYASLTGIFGWCALLLASVGIYSVVAVTIRARAAEIAIRTICGATRARIVRETLRYSMLPVASGLILGVVPGLLAAKTLASQLRIEGGQEAWTVASAAACLIATATIAAVIPAVRQTATDPARLLRDSWTAD